MALVHRFSLAISRFGGPGKAVFWVGITLSAILGTADYFMYLARRVIAGVNAQMPPPDFHPIIFGVPSQFWGVLAFAVMTIIVLFVRIMALEQSLEPALHISYEDNGYFSECIQEHQDFYGEVYTALTNGLGRRSYWVTITTNAKDAIPDCKVNVDAIYLDGINQVNFVDSLTRRGTDNEVFPLRNGDPKDVLLVSMNEIAPRKIMRVHYWRKSHRDMVFQMSPGTRYEIALSAVGSRTTAAKKRFGVSVSDGGRLVVEVIS